MGLTFCGLLVKPDTHPFVTIPSGSHAVSYLCHYLAVDLLFTHIIPLDYQDHAVSGAESGIVIVKRVVAHNRHTVGEVAENTSGIFPRDHSLPVRTLRVTELRAVKGIWLRFLDGDAFLYQNRRFLT